MVMERYPPFNGVSCW